MSKFDFRAAIREALAEGMEREESVVFFGGDVAAPGVVCAVKPELY